MKNIMLFSFFLFTFLQCDQPSTAQAESVEIIIFIHGTIKPPEISFSSLYKIMHDNTDATILALATDHVRKNPFFYQGQPIQELGLQPIVLSSSTSDNLPTRTAQTIAQVYNFQYGLTGKTSLKKLYYTFGWNGLLSISKRYQAAKEFYVQLQAEIRRLKNKNMNPIITIVTYSHGGNVALYLPAIHADYETKDNSLIIDKLIMLACPIQKETDYLVQDPLFTKVYNLFSTEDFVQQWDFFSTHGQFFSQRMFKNRRTFTVPHKVVQVRVRSTKKIRCITPEAIEKDINVLLNLSSKCFEHRDPGHMEIGGFSWGNYWYRDIFPLFPLPVIALAPTIIHAIEALLPTTTLATFDFIPEYNCALLIDNLSNRKHVHALWTSEERAQLWDNLCANIPLDYTFYNQETHYAQAVRTAHETLLKSKNGRKYRYPHNRTLARLLEKAKETFIPNTLLAHNKNHHRKKYRFSHHQRCCLV